jgi:hypothetical protein
MPSVRVVDDPPRQLTQAGARLIDTSGRLRPGAACALRRGRRDRHAPDCGGLLAFNYVSGEPITGLHEGRPLFRRLPDSTLNLADFVRTQPSAALATLRIGMNVLQEVKGVGRRRFSPTAACSPPEVWRGSCWRQQSTPAPVSVGDSAARAAPGGSRCWPPSASVEAPASRSPAVRPAKFRRHRSGHHPFQREGCDWVRDVRRTFHQYAFPSSKERSITRDEAFAERTGEAKSGAHLLAGDDDVWVH